MRYKWFGSLKGLNLYIWFYDLELKDLRFLVDNFLPGIFDETFERSLYNDLNAGINQSIALKHSLNYRETMGDIFNNKKIVDKFKVKSILNLGGTLDERSNG